ncbi:MAG: hypothetical protein M3332_17640 [Actinomycetota bacterium]|nr:hypothetical protein [Actinomycetota bacterium]
MAVLKTVNWTAVSSIIAVLALLVSSAVFRVHLTDRRRARADQERAQAEQVAGWLTVDREKKTWTAHARNGSTQPVYDVVYVVRDNEFDTDAAMPEFIPVIPPETTWSWSPGLFGPEAFDGAPEDANYGVYTLYDVDDRCLYVGSLRNSGLGGSINHRVYMTFRDGRGLTWQRDVHGRLTRFLRRIDDAPPADRVTGRIYRVRRGKE